MRKNHVSRILNIYPSYLHQWWLAEDSHLCSFTAIIFICFKKKWNFWIGPTEMPWLEGNSGGIEMTSLPLGEDLPVFPLSRFACCAAIFVVLTLISTYETLGDAEVPAVRILFTTQPFSLNIINSCRLAAWLQAFTDLSLVWNSVYYRSVCNLITNLISLLPHCVIYSVLKIH